MLVKVNTGPLLDQRFHPCTAEFIRDTCQARCCRSTTDPTGIAVVVTPVEAPRLRALGATVDPDTGRLAPVDRRCPFQDRHTHLCTVHATDEPLGCILSPFTINGSGTLIVRNRYRLLPCFKAPGAVPVWEAHSRSLRTMFGAGYTLELEPLLRAGVRTTLHMEVADAVVEAQRAKNLHSRSRQH